MYKYLHILGEKKFPNEARENCFFQVFSPRHYQVALTVLQQVCKHETTQWITSTSTI
jgi:hypothetical protein